MRRSVLLASAAGALSLGAGFVMVDSAAAHPSWAIPYCHGIAVGGENRGAGTLTVTIDGTRLFNGPVGTNVDQWYGWTQTAPHTYTVVFDATDDRFDAHYEGTTTPCQSNTTTTLPPSTTTSTVAPTTSVATSSSIPTPVPSPAPTVESSTSVPSGSSVPTTAALSTTTSPVVAVGVPPAPTAQPPRPAAPSAGVLPATGVDVGTLLVAAAVLAVGIVALYVSRRRP